jgi:hypothetical protein
MSNAWCSRGEKEQLTPRRRVWVVDGGVDVTKIDLAHEAINLNEVGDED